MPGSTTRLVRSSAALKTELAGLRSKRSIIMRVAALVMLVLAVAGVEEPLPSSPAEEQDEVAQSQRRSRWIACLSLARSYSIEHELELSSILTRTVHSKEATRRRIIAGIVETCAVNATDKVIQTLLETEELDIFDEEWEPFLNIDEAFYLSPESNVSLTATQEALYSSIREVTITQEIFSTKESLDVEPPLIEQPTIPTSTPETPPETIDYQRLGAIVGGNVVLLMLGICEM